MGQVKVIENLQNGKYKVEIIRNLTNITDTMQRLQLENNAITASIEKDQKQADDLTLLINQLNVELNILIDNSAELSILQASARQLNLKHSELTALEKGIVNLESSLRNNIKLLAALKRTLPPRVLSAWCCDFSENITVGSVVPSLELTDEFNGDNRTLLVMPHSLIATSYDVDLKQSFIVANELIFSNNKQKTNELVLENTTLRRDIDGLILLNSSLSIELTEATIIQDLQLINELEQQLKENITELETKNTKIETNNKVITELNRLNDRVFDNLQILINEKTELERSLSSGDVVKNELTNRNGILTPALGLDTWVVAYNIALLAGLQKHKPRFRVGIITRLDAANNRVDVALDPAKSTMEDIVIYESAQKSDYNINQKILVENVWVQYMDCGIDVFKITDRVVLDFGTDISTPVCIGFYTEPQDCISLYLSINTHPSNFISETRLAVRVGNDSLLATEKQLLAGNIDWRADNKLLTWNGGFSRVRSYGTLIFDFNKDLNTIDNAYDVKTFQVPHPDNIGHFGQTVDVSFAMFDRYGTSIFSRGELFNVVVPLNVLGACIAENGENYCVAYQRDDLNLDVLYQFNDQLNNWEVVQVINHFDADYLILNRETPVFFNKNGDKFITSIDRINVNNFYNWELNNVIPTFNQGSTEQLIERVYTTFSIVGGVVSTDEIVTSNKGFTRVSSNTATCTMTGNRTQSTVAGVTITPTHQHIAARDWHINDEDLETINELIFSTTGGINNSTASFDDDLQDNNIYNSANDNPNFDIDYSVFTTQDTVLNWTASSSGSSSRNYAGNSGTESESSDSEQLFFLLFYCDLREDLTIFKSTKIVDSSSSSASFNALSSPAYIKNTTFSIDYNYQYEYKKASNNHDLNNVQNTDSGGNTTNTRPPFRNVCYITEVLSQNITHPISYIDVSYREGIVFYARDARDSEILQLYSFDLINFDANIVESWSCQYIKNNQLSTDGFDFLYDNYPNAAEKQIYGLYDRPINEEITGPILSICPL